MIAHIDMDAFFAKCEKLRRPELKEKPVVICIYTRNKSSGAVSTCDYRAREKGITSGMSLREAEEKATKETEFLEADHEFYRRKSEEVMAILSSFTNKIQKTSVDEAYFRLEGEELEKARKIKAGVESLGLTASIGIAPNKFLAKLASEDEKPDGLVKVEQDERKQFLKGKSVGELHGVGSKTEKALKSHGINTVEDLRGKNNSWLVDKFGRDKAASLKMKARGKGSRKLETGQQKQISKIKTMERNSRSHRYIMKELETISESLMERVNEKGKAFRRLTLIAIDLELDQYTRSRKVDTSESKRIMLEEADRLLRALLEDKQDKQFRRIGLRVSDLMDRNKQASLQSF